MPTKCLIGFKLFKQRRCGFTDPAWRRTSGWRSSTTQRFGSWAWTRARFTGRKALRRTAATTTRTAAITKCVLLCYLSSRFLFLFSLLSSSSSFRLVAPMVRACRRGPAGRDGRETRTCIAAIYRTCILCTAGATRRLTGASIWFVFHVIP